MGLKWLIHFCSSFISVYGIQSPVQQNPYVDVAADHQPLRLAINTAQYGRTFQDRSHVFKIIPRPDGPGKLSLLTFIDKYKVLFYT